MGSSASTMKKRPFGSWVSSESDNPFELAFGRKERLCLRETYLKLSDPKEIIGRIFLKIVNDIAPELKEAFGVERVPMSRMTRMPKFGGHVLRLTELLDQTSAIQMTTMIGFTENLYGAWQLARKTGRMHTSNLFLENCSNLARNYFSIVGETFTNELMPLLCNNEDAPSTADAKKHVRFASTYPSTMINDVWRRFFQILVAQMSEAFEQESMKRSSKISQQTLAPHQHAEEDVRKRKKVQDRAAEIENLPSMSEQRTEELLEDPF